MVDSTWKMSKMIEHVLIIGKMRPFQQVVKSLLQVRRHQRECGQNDRVTGRGTLVPRQRHSSQKQNKHKPVMCPGFGLHFFLFILSSRSDSWKTGSIPEVMKHHWTRSLNHETGDPACCLKPVEVPLPAAV